METIPCPDAYLLDPQSPLAAGHHALNQYLLRVEDVGWQKALKEMNAIRDKGLKLRVWKALLDRLHWLRKNNPSSSCLSPLRGLAERIEKWSLSPTEGDLIEILDRTAELAGFTAPYTPMHHLMEYIEKNGLTPTLSAAIRDFRNRVWEQAYTVNQVSLQMFRSRMKMLAWRDEWNEVNLKRCWSERIRADFRSMQGVERENWGRLLHSINGDESTRPRTRWLNDLEIIAQAIGTQAFRDRIMQWLEPLTPGATQRLSREGSFILRSVIWAAVAVNEPQLLARVADIRAVKFKPKSNGEKVVYAATDAMAAK